LLLQKVDHIDDLAADWNEVSPFLRDGLATTAANQEHILEYVKLHEKWFDQCNATAEYQNLRRSLENNLLQSIQQHFDRYSYVTRSATTCISLPPQLDLVFQILQVWHSMWMTIIQQTEGDDDDNDDEMKSILKLTLAPVATTMTPNSFVLMPGHLLAVLDPYAEWFQYWAQHLPPQRLSQVMRPFLPELFRRGQKHEREEPTQYSAPSMTTVELDESTGDDAVSRTQLQSVLHLQAVSILESVLVNVRVLLFPWDASITQSTIAGSSCTPDQEVLSLFRIFLQLSLNAKDRSLDTCIRGIETLLYGSYRNDAVFPQILSELRGLHHARHHNIIISLLRPHSTCSNKAG
jgi:hypothetical protein